MTEADREKELVHHLQILRNIHVATATILINVDYVWPNSAIRYGLFLFCINWRKKTSKHLHTTGHFHPER